MITSAQLEDALIKQLRARAVHAESDIETLIAEFGDSALAGGRLLVSDGDGCIRMLVPIADGYDGPQRVDVVPMGNPSQVLETVEAGPEVEIAGLRFAEFLLSPLAYKGAFGASDESRPALGIRGSGPDGDWAPFGFDGWFWEDLLLVTDLAVRGGIETRPDVEVDPKDPNWKALDSDARAVVEKALGRRVPGVVHTSTLQEAIRRAGNHDGAVSGALRSLSLSLGAPGESAPEKASSESESIARPIFEAIFGVEFFDPTLWCAKLGTLAASMLTGPRHADLRKALRDADATGTLTEGAQNAMDRAFGAGFSADRTPTLQMVDAALDQQSSSLTYMQTHDLRRLRADLQFALEADLFGADFATRPLASSAADSKLRELYDYLGKSLQLRDAPLFSFANQLQNALNVTGSKPAVIVLAGDQASGVDALLERTKRLVGDKTLDIQGAGSLRDADPVGYLIGDPAGQTGIVRGALMTYAASDFPKVTTMTGLESLGAGLVDDATRKTATESFWSFISQARRDGWFRGYEATPGETALGTRVDLNGKVLILRTSQSVSELQASMTPEAWHQISHSVVDFGRASHEAVVSQIARQVGDFVRTEYGFADSEVDIAESMQSFLTSLLESGVNAQQLQDMVLAQVKPHIFYLQVEGRLGTRIRLEMLKGLTARELHELRRAWTRGEFHSLAGGSTMPFAVFDEGRYSAGTSSVPSALVQAPEQSADERMQRLIDQLQRRAAGDESLISDLMRRNEQLQSHTGAAESRIGELEWLNTRATWEIDNLKDVRKELSATIDVLKEQLRESNSRIELLNTDLGTAKDAGSKLEADLRVAVDERDEIERVLRATETDFQGAILSFAGATVGDDPQEVFTLVAARAGQQDGHHFKAMLSQLVALAAGRALRNAQTLRNQRTNKFQEIANLARGYAQACAALKQTPNATVLRGFENAARLSGNGWNNQMAKKWQETVGKASQYKGEDPALVTNALKNLGRRLGFQF